MGYFTAQLLYYHNLKSIFQRLQVKKNLHLITCVASLYFFYVLDLQCAGKYSTLPIGHRAHCEVDQEQARVLIRVCRRIVQLLKKGIYVIGCSYFSLDRS